MSEQMICPDCEGSGELAGNYFASDNMQQCEKCRGTGLVDDDEMPPINPTPASSDTSDEMPEWVQERIEYMRWRASWVPEQTQNELEGNVIRWLASDRERLIKHLEAARIDNAEMVRSRTPKDELK